MDQSITPRPALATDRRAITETLAWAFDDDAIANWSVRQDEQHHAALALFFRTLFDLYLPLGMTFTVNDGQGAALWAPHDRWRPPLWRELSLAPVYLRVCGRARLLPALRGLHALQKHHPRTPHYYLFSIGVHPEHQRKGLASALLAHTLAQCDRERKDAYLEATSLHNKALYLRHGFEVIEEFPFGEGGPVLTAMLRKPR